MIMPQHRRAATLEIFMSVETILDNGHLASLAH